MQAGGRGLQLVHLIRRRIDTATCLNDVLLDIAKAKCFGPNTEKATKSAPYALRLVEFFIVTGTTHL